MPNVWEFVRARKQIRKKHGLWELWVFHGRSWARVAQASSWSYVVWMATGLPEYRPADTDLVPRVVWQP